jgi:murein DD-endopeptidase MepM/ murein hydrolase activator NlpD
MKLMNPCPAGSFRISQKWGENPDIYSRWGYGGHNGWDYAYPSGTSVYTVADGRVSVVGWDEHGYGLWIEVIHDFGRTRYAHGLPGTASVSVGQDILGGDLIMQGGTSGFSTGPHLHFEIRVSDAPDRYGVDFYPTRWGSFCIDPGPFMPTPHGEGRAIGDDNVDDRISKLEAELRSERGRADLNYTKMLDAMSDLGFTVRAMNGVDSHLGDDERARLTNLNDKWFGKI